MRIWCAAQIWMGRKVLSVNRSGSVNRWASPGAEVEAEAAVDLMEAEVEEEAEALTSFS